MKKLYTLVAAMALPLVMWGGVALPYGPTNFESLSDTKNDDVWTKKNAGTTASTWVMGATTQTSTVGGVSYDSARIWDFNGNEGYNSWLISPLFTLEAGKTYKVTYNMNVWNDTGTRVQNLDVLLLATSPIDDADAALSTGRVLKSYTELGQAFYKAAWNAESVVFSVAEGGDYYVSFRVYNYMVKCPQVSAFSISETTESPDPGPDPVDPDPVDPDEPTEPLPYSSALSDGSNLATGWNPIDSNNDNKTWSGDAKGAKYHYNTSKAADDWLVSPAFYLELEKNIKFFISIRQGIM